MTTKYDRLRQDLEATGTGTMKCFGSSMVPRLKNGCTNTYERTADYDVGDIVFCKVKGRFIDAHLVVAKAADGRWLIANNHGHQNGWTRTVYGRVVETRDGNGSPRRP